MRVVVCVLVLVLCFITYVEMMFVCNLYSSMGAFEGSFKGAVVGFCISL